ncbi:MAG: insulinase family protein [bacterium]|nr:insulinase family protein [bacterium]
MRPTFPGKEFERLRGNYRGRQKQEAVQPQAQAMNEFQRRCFGATHPYAQPASGVGTRQSLDALTRQDLVTFHGSWFVPANAAVVVVGDLTLAEATAAVSRVLGNWRNASTPKRVPLPETGYQGPRLVVIDRPGAQQSQIMGGYVGMPRGDADFPGFEVLNSAFGGQFASRINLNLREDKGYTYGVRSQLAAYRHAGVFLMSAPVQTNATAASIGELLNEMRQARGERPVAGDELADSKGTWIPSVWSGSSSGTGRPSRTACVAWNWARSRWWARPGPRATSQAVQPGRVAGSGGHGYRGPHAFTCAQHPRSRARPAAPDHGGGARRNGRRPVVLPSAVRLRGRLRPQARPGACRGGAARSGGRPPGDAGRRR